MAVYASTAEPGELARKIVEAIKRGAVATWEMTSGHLRHADTRAHVNAPGRERDAYFKIVVTEGAVKFALVASKRTEPFDRATYAYHHGRLTELLLGQFSDVVTRVQSTPFAGFSGTNEAADH